MWATSCATNPLSRPVVEPHFVVSPALQQLASGMERSQPRYQEGETSSSDSMILPEPVRCRLGSNRRYEQHWRQGPFVVFMGTGNQVKSTSNAARTLSKL